jgi:hypothetical protein
LNYAGKFDAKLSAEGSGLHSNGPVHVETVHAAHVPSDAIIIPDAHLLFHGEFKRSGVDLILSKDAQELVLHEYFKGEKRAALASPDGARLTGDIVNALSGHVEYAQADGSASVSKIIGHVTKLVGTATAIRNGVSIILNNGDNVEKGDVVESGADSRLGITFIDGTVFGLSSNARMVLNEMVYDPNGSNNSSLLSLVSGTMTFVAGDTAKHGDMKIDTPVATMGIRGTAVLVRIDFVAPKLAPGVVPDPGTLQALLPELHVQVVVEPDGTVGSLIMYEKSTLTPLAVADKAGVQINITNGIVSQSSNPLSPELQKLIDEVFTLRFTDNSNTKTTVVQNDSIVPKDGTFGFHLPDGTIVTAVFSTINNSPLIQNNSPNFTPFIFFIPKVALDHTAATQGTTIHATGGGTNSFAWQVSSDNGKDWTTVGTDATYTPTENDEGKLLQLVVNNASQTFSLGTVAEDPAEKASISLDGLTSGHAVDGTLVTATVTDPDAPASSSIIYTWKVDGTTVASGAGLNTFTPIETEGKTLTVSVSFTDIHGNAETGTQSAGTVAPVAETPTLTIASHTVSIAEETGTALGISVTAHDGDDVLSITIGNVPNDATLTYLDAEKNIHTLTPIGGVYTLTVDQLNGLTLNAGEQTGPVTLSVSATNTTTGETASVNDTISLTVDPIQENPIFSGATATTVDEPGSVVTFEAALATHAAVASELGGVVTLGATVATHDADDGAISVTITGLAHDLSAVNGGSYDSESGTWSGTAAEFNALTFKAGEDGTQHLTITATTGGAEAGSTVENYTLTVNPIQENPIFGGATATTVNEQGGVVTLGATVATHDADDGTISVTIAGLAHDLNTFNGGSYDSEAGTWSGTAAEFNALTFKAGEDGIQHLTITATTGGAEAGSTVENYTLTVNPVAEAASLAGTMTAVSGGSDSAIPLTIVATPFDNDDNLSIQITGVPSDVTLNHGTHHSNGSYTLTLAQLSGLKFNADEGSAILHVVVTSSEGAVSTTSSTDIAVTVDGHLTIAAGDTYHFNGGTLQDNSIEVDGTLQGFGTITRGSALASIVNNGTIESTSNNPLNIHGNITGTGLLEIKNGATLELGSSVGSNQSVVFNIGGGSAGELILDNPGGFQAKISGFNGNDIIDLKSMAYSGSTSTLLDSIHHTATVGAETISLSIGSTETIVTVSEAGTTATIKLEGNYNGHSFTFSSDGSGGTQFVDPLAIDSGATLEVPGASADNVLFVNNVGISGTLVLDDATAFSGQISGFSGTSTTSDAIDLKSITFDSETKWTYTANSAGTGGALTIYEGVTVVDTIEFTGNYTTANFKAQSDSNGGTLVTDPPTSSPAVHSVVMQDPGPLASSTIVASAPDQTLSGIAASDTFVFNFANVGHATVADFHPESDTLQFKSPIFANALAALNATHDDGHGNTVVAIDSHDTITLAGVLKAQLHASDFHIV